VTSFLGKENAMPQQLGLRGQYVRVNEAQLRERANRKDDPRHIFYEAMLENDSYEAYEAVIGTKMVRVETWTPPSMVSGHTEIRYARNDRGWIEDASGGPGGRKRSLGPRARRPRKAVS
jgi:hypothetical protein